MSMAHPEKTGFESVRFNGRIDLKGSNVPAPDKNLFGKSNADAFAGLCLLPRAGIPPLDARHPARLVRRREDQGVSDAQRATLNAPGNNATLIKTTDVLHRKSQRQIAE